MQINTHNALEAAQQLLPTLPPAAQQRVGQLINELNKTKSKELSQKNFMAFVKYVWPTFINGRHHKIMADAFQDVVEGKVKRLIINMPPRHTKSEFASYLLPAWFLGLYPEKKVIQASNTGELAVGFGRKVRNLVDSAPYKDIFPATLLQSDSKAAGRWATNHGGDYFAIGVGGTVTGKGADLLIIDDPHSEQEATLAENNSDIYDKTYEWYTSGPRQRLQPGGAIIVVMCMTGDTPVLMADGTEKPLWDIRPMDEVATYENDELTTTRVLNHQSSGVDSILTITTRSGRILRANERHPFLVESEGERKWIRLKNLKPGMALVALKDVADPQERRLEKAMGYATPVRRGKRTTRSTLMRLLTHWATTVSGKVKLAHTKDAAPLRVQKGTVKCTTSMFAGERGIVRHRTPPNHAAVRGSSIATGLIRLGSTGFSRSKAAFAQFVGNLLQSITPARTGTTSSALTMSMTRGRFGGYSATTATLPLGIQKPQQLPMPWQGISDFTTDEITSITPSGQEEVFDVEIERTECFIANGVVSKNTRWSKKDLTGQVLKAAAQRSGEEWKVIELPALMPSGAPLWPEFWSKKELDALHQELPLGKWMAQYQQQPTSDVSAIIKREWWQWWEETDAPYTDFTIQSWDTAFLKTERSDYSACTTWGVFYKPDDTGKNQANIILLNSFKQRMEFPELKQRAYREYKEWEPDSLIVEAKASGSPLIFELRAMGIPVQEFTPSKGNDKIARLNAVADIFASGRVWVPRRAWAEELVEEVASFPSGEHDDLVDSCSQAIMRFRRGGFIRLDSDEQDEPPQFRGKKKPYY